MDALTAGRRELLERFSRAEYGAAFAEYKAGCMPFFQALDAAPEAAEAGAAALLDALEAGRAGKRRRAAALSRDDDKRLLALYLAPAAVDSGLAGAARFARELSRQWNARYPGSPFYVGSYQEIAEGFRRRPLRFLDRFM